MLIIEQNFFNGTCIKSLLSISATNTLQLLKAYGGL